MISSVEHFSDYISTKNIVEDCSDEGSSIFLVIVTFYHASLYQMLFDEHVSYANWTTICITYSQYSKPRNDNKIGPCGFLNFNWCTTTNITQIILQSKGEIRRERIPFRWQYYTVCITVKNTRCHYYMKNSF